MIKQIDKYKMINKVNARKLYKNQDVYIVGSNVNSYHFLNGWHLACRLNREWDFEQQLNSYLFYLDPEIGRYARFFVL